MMYKHRNMQQCYQKRTLLMYIGHLLDKCKKKKNLQNAQYIHQEYVPLILLNNIPTMTINKLFSYVRNVRMAYGNT
jgi:hypothetical protein